MPFLENIQFESIPVSSTIKNGIHMVKEFPLGDFFKYRHYGDYRGFYQCDEDLYLYRIDRPEKIFSSLKIDSNGIIYQFQDKVSTDLQGSMFSFTLLPLVGVLNIFKRKQVKISFLMIPGYSNKNKIMLPDVKINKLGCYLIDRYKVTTSRNYFAFSLALNRKHGSFFFASKAKQHWPNETEFLLLLFEIKTKAGDVHQTIEIFRDKIQDYIPRGGIVNEIVFNEQQDIILLYVTIWNYCSEGELHYFLIYDIKCRYIKQRLDLGVTRNKISKLYFLQHSMFDADLIVALGLVENKVYYSSSNHGLKFLTSIGRNCSCEINGCIKNWNSQILLFLGSEDQSGTLTVRDLFDQSNKEIIPCRKGKGFARIGSSYFGTVINSNKTGDVIYIWDDTKLRVFIYKPFPKSLVSLCGRIVSETFSRLQLENMNYPRHLYKYILSSCQ